jgi:hypothetical protein
MTTSSGQSGQSRRLSPGRKGAPGCTLGAEAAAGLAICAAAGAAGGGGGLWAGGRDDAGGGGAAGVATTGGEVGGTGAVAAGAGLGGRVRFAEGVPPPFVKEKSSLSDDTNHGICSRLDARETPSLA